MTTKTSKTVLLEESTTTPSRKELEWHPDLSVDQYNSVVKWCREAIDNNADFLYDRHAFDLAIADASLRYDMPIKSIISLIRNTHVFHVKGTARSIKAKIPTHYIHRYTQKGESLWQIAKSIRYPPYPFARAMLDVILHASISRNSLTTVMRDPVTRLSDVSVLAEVYQCSETFPGPSLSDSQSSVSTTRLAREVLHVIALDPMYGPEHDAVRHSIGVEYERLLEELLTSMGIPFETEEQLRERGSSKTPDVLLSTPVAVQVKRPAGNTTSTSANENDDGWRIVCWIDSKGLFGDAHTHKDSVLPQAESYIHRFGPGLLLYWFGHAPLLDDANGDLVIKGWTLPDEFLLPTGEVVVGPSATSAIS